MSGQREAEAGRGWGGWNYLEGLLSSPSHACLEAFPSPTPFLRFLSFQSWQVGLYISQRRLPGKSHRLVKLQRHISVTVLESESLNRSGVSRCRDLCLTSCYVLTWPPSYEDTWPRSYEVAALARPPSYEDTAHTWPPSYEDTELTWPPSYEDNNSCGVRVRPIFLLIT